MKNKKLTYILVFAVLIIWILIIRQIFGFFKKDEVVPMNKSQIQTSKVRNQSIDTIVLIADYEDPFFVNSKHTTRDIQTTTLNKTPVVPVNKTEKVILPVKWPDIEFEGIIKSSSKLQGLIYIDRRQYIVSENNSYDDILIREIYKDSIVVVYRDQAKSFKK